MNTPHFASLTTSELFESYSQLSDKALIDFINCLEVNSDHLRVRDRRTSVAKRLFNFINGESDRRQQQIDWNHQTGLENVLKWLQHLEVQQANSDLAIGLVTDKLIETRAGIMRLQERLLQSVSATREEFDAVWAALDKQEEFVRHRLHDHEQRLQCLELKTAAKQQVELVISRWREGRYAAHGLGQRLFLACNTLNWGDFGVWLRKTSPSQDRDQVIEITISQLKEQLKYDSQMTEPILSLEEWFAMPSKSAASSDHQEVLHYLSESYQTQANSPLPRFAGMLAQPSSTDLFWTSLQLPRLAGPSKLVRYMLTQTALTQEMLKC